MVESRWTQGSSPISPSEVCLVTVTYGDRGHLCSAVVDAALRQGVGRAIVVLNGPSGRSVDVLSDFARSHSDRVDLVRLPSNLGSAVGFSIGIRSAVERTTLPYVWLLDDDNVALDAALTQLLYWRTMLASCHASEDIVVFAARPATRMMAALLSGVSAARAYPSRGGFAGFNVVDIPWKLARRLGRRGGPVISRPVEIPYGPYGGMLLSRALVRRAGYPDERLVLYEDDADYTRRLNRAGAKLFVVPTAVVKDIDASWYVTARGRTPFGRVLSAESDTRVYFTRRNRVYFETTHWSGPRPLYLLNKVVYIAMLSLLGLATGRQDRVRLVLEAVGRGEKQDFGVREGSGLENGRFHLSHQLS
jgi:GT2 family glycosyltransferase